ncbi:glycerate kinase [Lachnobacterium bovis]|uniref:Glycerate kinase n=1 Tax=Lachnobacterium bovis DSM 14045 TaxID=1122142 RepID=A0A1H3IWM8_9FIRM|nr:glycerate kinase [Lachnobacterium bovis]SDY32101.1 glycerate kinase [Lachnobacterium bovis DSM 14045]
MKVVIAIDSFKGSLSSIEAAESIKKGICEIYKDAQVKISPLADGGEGTTYALTKGMNGEFRKVKVSGPLENVKVVATYGIIKDTKTAIIEMSQAAGITLVPPEKRNPLRTTTYGVGEIIKDAIKQGCRHFIVGIGGSATNDGGIGMLQALGYDFFDESGNKISQGASACELEHLVKIDDSNVIKELKECDFKIACDVTNPLCGKNGCSEVFGPQKGATDDMVKKMDNWLKNYSILAKKIKPKADANYPGTGAAGGLGFAFLTFTKASLESGIDIVLKETKLEELVKDADIVVTGEGRLDKQTVMGKAPIGVAQIAKKYNKKVIAFAGAVTKEARILNENGIDAFFPILREVITEEEAMSKEVSSANLEETVREVFALIKAMEDN